MRNLITQRSDRRVSTQEPNATGEGADWTSALSSRPDLTVAISRSAVFGRRSTATTQPYEHTGGDDE
jgi:hypothetical protein